MLEKIKAFLNIKPPKTDLAAHIRKKSFEEERLRLAEIEGKKEAQFQSNERLSKLITSKAQQVTKTNWRNNLQSLSNIIDETFKPSIKINKIEKLNDDGISRTFKPIMMAKTKKSKGKKKLGKAKKKYVIVDGKAYPIGSEEVATQKEKKIEEKPKKESQFKDDGISPTFSL